MKRTLLFWLLLSCFPLVVSADGIDSYGTDFTSTTMSITANDAGWGQTFTVNRDYSLNSVDFYLSWSGSSDFEVQALLFSAVGKAGSSGIPNTVNLENALASSNVVYASTYSGSPQLITFKFNNYKLMEGNDYSIAVVMKNRVAGTNHMVAVDDRSPTHSGNAFYRNNGGSTVWSASSERDVIFYLYGTESGEATVKIEVLYEDPENEMCNIRWQVLDKRGTANNITFTWSDTSSNQKYHFGYDDGTEIANHTASFTGEQINFVVDWPDLIDGGVYKIWETESTETDVVWSDLVDSEISKILDSEEHELENDTVVESNYTHPAGIVGLIAGGIFVVIVLINHYRKRS